MSANLILDLSATALPATSGKPNISIAPNANVASGVIIGQVVDMLEANTFTNLFAAGGPSISGQFRIRVQTSDTTTSGSFTDPTSGLADMPTNFLSGGVAVFNSGNTQMNSGGIAFAGFLSPHRYFRACALSGDQFNGSITVGVVKQLKTTGSGGGFSYSPQSGTVDV